MKNITFVIQNFLKKIGLLLDCNTLTCILLQNKLLPLFERKYYYEIQNSFYCTVNNRKNINDNIYFRPVSIFLT